MLDEALVPLPPKGRVFRAARTVRLADADRRGRLRLDACARYLQDVGHDDTADSGVEDPRTTWVVRRAVIDVHRPPRWREWLELATWCGGIGGRWAERRLSIDGDRGGRVEIATLWVHVAVATMAPARLPASFLDTYGPAAGGRRVSSRRWLDGVAEGTSSQPWPLRAVDVDLLGHINNAAYWAAVEEVLASGGGHAVVRQPHRAVMEYGAGIEPGAGVELRVDEGGDRLRVWLTEGPIVHAAAVVLPLPPAAAPPT